LRELAMYIHVSEPVECVRKDWSQLTRPELDEQVLSFAESGATVDAVNLLVASRGYSTTQARNSIPA
jgi:hypothetical protein